MFIEQGIKQGNNFWQYIYGLGIIFFITILGTIPLYILFDMFFSSGNQYPDSIEFMRSFDSNISLAFMLLSCVFTLLGVFYVVRKVHRQTLLSVTTTRSKIDWKRVFFSFSIWSVFIIISIMIDFYLNPNNFVINFELVPFLILVLIGVLLIPIQTSSEEYLFRGYLMQGFGNLAKNKWVPLLMTSVIFGVMHLLNPEVTKMGNITMVYYIGTGLFLGIITLMDEGMELALGFHAANNLLTALLVTSDWSAFQTHSIFKDVSEPSAGLDVILPVVIIYPMLLFVFSKKYRWTNWKEKLTGKISVPQPFNDLNSI